MGFGMSYEMVITLFVVLFGLLFITLGYNELAVPFIQLTFLFGFVIAVLGWLKKDYDTFYTGILMMVITFILISVFPSMGVPKSSLEGGLLYAIGPIFVGVAELYIIHPLFFVLVVVLLVYAFARK